MFDRGKASLREQPRIRNCSSEDIDSVDVGVDAADAVAILGLDLDEASLAPVGAPGVLDGPVAGRRNSLVFSGVLTAVGASAAADLHRVGRAGRTLRLSVASGQIRDVN